MQEKEEVIGNTSGQGYWVDDAAFIHCWGLPVADPEEAELVTIDCEQRLLFPERIPKWETQNLPICDLWCQECAIQRCCTRGSHQYHLCMQCERRGVVFLAPVGGEDPWAANDD